MPSDLGTVAKDIRDWIAARVYINAFDVDAPDTNNYLGYDAQPYPSNTATFIAPSSIGIEKTYYGSVCTADINLRFCFRYLRELYPTKESLPIFSLMGLYHYVVDSLVMDKSFINFDILQIRVDSEKDDRPITIGPEEEANLDSDWLAYLNFQVEVKFVSTPLFNFYRNTPQPEDRKSFPEVSPAPAGQVGAPYSTTNPDIKPAWEIKQIDVGLNRAKLNELDTDTDIEVELNISVDET